MATDRRHSSVRVVGKHLLNVPYRGLSHHECGSVLLCQKPQRVPSIPSSDCSSGKQHHLSATSRILCLTSTSRHWRLFHRPGIRADAITIECLAALCGGMDARGRSLLFLPTQAQSRESGETGPNYQRVIDRSV